MANLKFRSRVGDAPVFMVADTGAFESAFLDGDVPLIDVQALDDGEFNGKGRVAARVPDPFTVDDVGNHSITFLVGGVSTEYDIDVYDPENDSA